MTAYLKALLLVVVGEMGDKTQLLAMGMAGKYRVKDVMLGVLVATLLNHALAVLVGTTLGAYLPMQAIAIAAGISFLLFGLWTIRGDEDGGASARKSRFGPVMTVAIAFFIAEIGDKTQLMTVALAAEFRQPVWVLAGTTTGMLAADAIGVFFEAWICRNIPESSIKWLAGLVFIFFGSLSLYHSLPGWMVSPAYAIPYLFVLAAAVYLVGVRFARKEVTPCEAQEAYDNTPL